MNWKNMPVSHKIATLIAGIAFVLWLVYKLQPSLFPLDPTYPAIALFSLCEAVIYWKDGRKWSYLLIAGAVICLGCFMLEQLL